MACNDEPTLARCLESVAFADEIVVVVDTKSRDASEKIATELATRVVVHRYSGDLEQKRTLTGLARFDWVLCVDADEEVSPELAASIRRRVRASGNAAGRFRAESRRVAPWPLGAARRLAPRLEAPPLRAFGGPAGSAATPTDEPEVDGPVERLEGDLFHYSYRDLADQLDRIGVHTSQAAEALHAEGRRPRVSDLVLRPPARFLRSYLLKRGFLDGLVGFEVAVTIAYSVFLKYAKLRQLWGSRGE